MSRAALRNRVRGTLLGAAIGDALGAPFEGAAAGGRVEEPAEARLMAYTDDTHMTLAVARSLIACRGLDSTHMARTFLEHHDAEPWRGYGAGPPRVFSLVRQGVSWWDAAQILYGGGSYGNGGAMRVAPVGLVAGPCLDRVDRWARTSARITHAHPLGMEGAALQAAAVASLVHGHVERPVRKEKLLELLRARLRTDTFREALDRLAELPLDLEADRVASLLGCGVEAEHSVPTALYIFLRSRDDFQAAIRFAVALGGDADTIASMSGALCGGYLGEEAIPAGWLEALEDAGEIRKLADALVELPSDGGAEGR